MKNILFFFLLISIHLHAQYDHQNINFVGRFDDTLVQPEPSYGIRYQACWGWTDSIGREYGIIGSSAGTYITNVTNPATPVLCDYVPSAHGNLIWHEYKTYGNLLYILSDNPGTNFQIADLSYLPDSVHLVYDSTDFIEHAHTIFIDGNKMYLGSVAEAMQYSAMNVYSLANPAAPVLLHRLSDDYPLIGQVHDMFVSNDTVYASCGNDGLFIFRYDSAANRFFIISSLQDNTNIYNHSSVLSPDHNYLYLCEEVPDGRPVKIIDVHDITNPFVDTTFFTHTGATPHNPSVKGNMLIVAYYMDGVYVYDITNPRVPVEIGFFDSYPFNAPGVYPQPAYAGSWSTYNDLPSGILLNGDMESGLFTLDISQLTTGLSAVNSKKAFLFPNPVREFLTIGNVPGSKIIFYDSTGRLIRTLDCKNNSVRADVTDLSEGLYYLKIYTGEEVISGKFIKQ